MSCQSRFNARYWMLGAGALGRPRGTALDTLRAFTAYQEREYLSQLLSNKNI